jgi:hypothetical protein
VSGSSLTTGLFLARPSARTSAEVVLVDYRLLPEHPFWRRSPVWGEFPESEAALTTIANFMQPRMAR